LSKSVNKSLASSEGRQTSLFYQIRATTILLLSSPIPANLTAIMDFHRASFQINFFGGEKKLVRFRDIRFPLLPRKDD
jgi:hypothetical protein